MKMYRTSLAAIGLALALTLIPGKAAADTPLTIVGGGSGGLWSIICEGIGETVRRSHPETRVTTEPGKDGPNQVLLSRRSVQFALASDTLTLMALKGEGPFKGRKLENLRLVAVMNPSQAMQFFVDETAGVASIEDIAAKKAPLKITVNRQGTVIDILSEAVLNAYGVSYRDIENWGGKIHKIPGPEAVDLWDAGQMNAIIEVSQFPTSRFYELGQKHDLRMLCLSPEKQAALNERLGTTSITMPAGTYAFQKQDCPSVATQLVLLTTADQPDEMVTTVLEGMAANIDYLRSVHANLRDLSLERMAANTTIPLHPAAERFFREHSSK